MLKMRIKTQPTHEKKIFFEDTGIRYYYIDASVWRFGLCRFKQCRLIFPGRSVAFDEQDAAMGVSLDSSATGMSSEQGSVISVYTYLDSA